MTHLSNVVERMGFPIARVTQTPTDERSREAAAQFAAELTRAAFAPLAKALGFYGDIAVANVARTMARAETGGLTDSLTSILARTTR